MSVLYTLCRGGNVRGAVGVSGAVEMKTARPATFFFSLYFCVWLSPSVAGSVALWQSWPVKQVAVIALIKPLPFSSRQDHTKAEQKHAFWPNQKGSDLMLRLPISIVCDTYNIISSCPRKCSCRRLWTRPRLGHLDIIKQHLHLLLKDFC
jgi:hypothetical protein